MYENLTENSSQKCQRSPVVKSKTCLRPPSLSSPAAPQGASLRLGTRTAKDLKRRQDKSQRSVVQTKN